MATARKTLRDLRVSKGKSTREMGVSQVWAIALEKGRQLPEANAVRKIAAALEVSTETVYAACQESVRVAHALQPTAPGAA